MASSLGGISLLSCGEKKPLQNIYRRLVHGNDELVPALLKKQERRSANKWLGGIPDNYGIHTAGGTARFIQVLTCAYFSSLSRFHGSQDLVEPMELAAGYLLKAQHSDGTIDLLTTNFYSTPDTGFVLEQLCTSFGIQQQDDSPTLAKLRARLQTFILKAADALVVGGIHTPNHRWVVCRALARTNSLFPNKKYIRRIDEWLNEGIDVDADGQFTEKSTSIYTPLTDHCLITLAKKLDRPELLEPVRRNLDMTFYYVHPDGEIVTEASKRQDQYKRGSMARYHYPYLYMALADQNGQYAAMTQWIEETAKNLLNEDLVYFLEDSSLQGELPAPAALPTNYNKFFKHSDLARIRRGDVSATILAKNPIFFSFHKGKAALSMRFASAFFGKGQFKGEALEIEDGKYIMRQELDGPYYQPFAKDNIPAGDNWEENKKLRTKSEIQHLESIVEVAEQNGEFEITIDIHGTDNVPVAAELTFRSGGRLKGVHKVDKIKDAYILNKGFGQYSFDKHIITFGPGHAEHTWTQLRGAEKKLNGKSVYLTGFTPMKMKVRIA
ncbi:MAG: hypothetical protein GWP06_19485 [Actinobacteria bacterium]|nr:hypothetical protein [Actinomycetota bacterium]